MWSTWQMRATAAARGPMASIWIIVASVALLMGGLQVEAKYSPSESSPSSYKCVCAFDFDLTLRVPRSYNSHTDYDAAAPEGQQVLWACQNVPCAIAVASANSSKQKIQDVLQRHYPGTFYGDFFQTTAFQYGIHDKSLELQRIASSLSVSTDCVVLFDDTENNRKYADKAGAFFEHVNRGTGVAMWNYRHAMKALPSACFSRGRPGRR